MLRVYEKASMLNVQVSPNALEKKRILITGAAAGIGQALALGCARLGATVVLLDRKEADLVQVYDQIESSGGATPLMIPLDLSELNETSAGEIVTGIEAQCGGLDALVNNAAILGQLKTLNQTSLELWQRVLKVNMEAPFILTKACMPLLLQAEEASVIFTSSAVGHEPQAYWGAYAISNSGIESMADIWASEMEALSVRIHVVDPGPVRTGLRAEAFPAEDPVTVPHANEIINTYLYLLSIKGKGFNGAFINLSAP